MEDIHNYQYFISLVILTPKIGDIIFQIFGVQLLLDHGGRKEMFYLTTHSTYFIYGYMALDIWLRTILIVRKETRCRHIGYSFQLAARVLLYAPSHRQDSTNHSLCYTSRGALAGMRNSSMGPLHEGSIQRPIALKNANIFNPSPSTISEHANHYTCHILKLLKTKLNTLSLGSELCSETLIY